MTIHTTTNYGIAYCDDDTALGDLATVSAQAAATIDAALGRGGIAPFDATSLANEVAARVALAGRVTTLEQSVASTQVTYASGWAGVNDTTWSGLRYARRGALVTLSGAVNSTAAQANGSLIATLPPGCRPPFPLLLGVFEGSTVNVIVSANGDVRLSGTAGSGLFISGSSSWVATS